MSAASCRSCAGAAFVGRPVSVGEVVPDDVNTMSLAGGSVQELCLCTYRMSHSYLLLLFVPVHGPAVQILTGAGGNIFDEFRAVSPFMVKELHDKHKAYIVGVVDASIDQVKRWMDIPAERGGLRDLPFPVVCDHTGRFSGRFAGVWDAKAKLLNRAHVILDGKGVIRQLTINDAMVSRNVDELCRQLKAFRFVDEYGQVCPADWKSGDPTLTPDPEASRKYFKDKFSHQEGQH